MRVIQKIGAYLSLIHFENSGSIDVPDRPGVAATLQTDSGHPNRVTLKGACGLPPHNLEHWHLLGLLTSNDILLVVSKKKAGALNQKSNTENTNIRVMSPDKCRAFSNPDRDCRHQDHPPTRCPSKPGSLARKPKQTNQANPLLTPHRASLSKLSGV